MKKAISVILLCCCLIAMHATALAADDITVTASLSKAEPGDELTVSGTAAADTWITIEGTDNDGNILYFSAVLSDSSGAYSKTFNVPDIDDGTLTFTAGNGDMTASTSVEIYTPSNDDSDDDSSDSTDDESADESDDSSTNATATASVQASPTPAASETPESTGSVVPSVTPATSDEATGDVIQTGGAAQLFTGILIWILAGIFALLLIAGVILFLRKRKRI